MGQLVSQTLRQANEALMAESAGSWIDLEPPNSSLRVDSSDDKLYMLFLNNVYSPQHQVCLGFYLDLDNSFLCGSAMEDGRPHELTSEEEHVIEEIFEWLHDNKRISYGKA